MLGILYECSCLNIW